MWYQVFHSWAVTAEEVTIALVQDPQVRAAAESFRRGILFFKEGDPNAQENLRTRAEELINACRESYERSMETQVPF